MKHIIQLTIPIILIIILSSCKNLPSKEKPLEKIPEDMNLETYLQKVELPTHVVINFESTDVKSIDSARIYTASILAIDQEQAIDELVRGQIVDTKNYAEGPWLEAKEGRDKEYLTVYDDGESFGIDSSINGGLTYELWKGGEPLNKLSKVIANYPGPPDNIGQQFGYNLKSDYDSNVDLSFEDFSIALGEIEKSLNSIGFPEFELTETYSIDLDTMLAHYQLYLDSRDYFGVDENEQVTFSKEDEAYIFFLRQVIDDIPLSNVGWHEAIQMNDDTTNEVYATTMDIVFTKDGISHITASNFFNIEKGAEEKQLISGASVLNKVLQSYSDLLIDNEVNIFSLELNYVAIYQNENHYELLPAWIIGIAESSEWIEEDGSKSIIEDYHYSAFNAITGEKIERARDTQ